MKVLVTGAAGFIGKNTRVRLQDTPAPLPLDKRAGNLTNDDTIEIITLDKNHDENSIDIVTNLAEGFVWAPPQQIDAVIHLAANSGVRSFKTEDHENNVEATQNVLKWMTRYDVPMIVYASSSSVYGNSTLMQEDWIPAPMSPYAHSKWVCEKLVNRWAVEDQRIAVTFRLFNAIGRWQRKDMFPALIGDYLKVLSTIDVDEMPELAVFGTRLRSWTYVGDIVNAFWSGLNNFYYAARGTNMMFNIGSTNCLTQRDLIALFEKYSGTPIHPIQREPHPLEVQKTKPDMRHFIACMGWEPNNRNVDLGVQEILRERDLAVRVSGDGV